MRSPTNASISGMTRRQYASSWAPEVIAARAGWVRSIRVRAASSVGSSVPHHTPNVEPVIVSVWRSGSLSCQNCSDEKRFPRRTVSSQDGNNDGLATATAFSEGRRRWKQSAPKAPMEMPRAASICPSSSISIRCGSSPFFSTQ